MTTHVIEVYRSDPGWVIIAPGIGIAQTRRRHKVEKVARKMIADKTGAPVNQVAVTPRWL